MDAFIEAFNANRHWIMPGILALLICLLAREIRFFASALPMPASDSSPRKEPLFSPDAKQDRGFAPVFRRKTAPPIQGKSLSLGSAAIFVKGNASDFR